MKKCSFSEKMQFSKKVQFLKIHIFENPPRTQFTWWHRDVPTNERFRIRMNPRWNHCPGWSSVLVVRILQVHYEIWKKVQFSENLDFRDSTAQNRRTNSKFRASQNLRTREDLGILSTPHSRAFWWFRNPCSKNHQNTEKKCSFWRKKCSFPKKCSFGDIKNPRQQPKKSPRK